MCIKCCNPVSSGVVEVFDESDSFGFADCHPFGYLTLVYARLVSESKSIRGVRLKLTCRLWSSGLSFGHSKMIRDSNPRSADHSGGRWQLVVGRLITTPGLMRICFFATSAFGVAVISSPCVAGLTVMGRIPSSIFMRCLS